MSGQKFIKNAKNDPLQRVLKTNSVTRQVNFNGTKIDEKCRNSNETFWVIFQLLQNEAHPKKNLPFDIQQKRKSRIVDQPFHVLGFLVKNYLTIDAQNEIGRLEAGSFRRTAWFYSLDLQWKKIDKKYLAKIQTKKVCIC